MAGFNIANMKRLGCIFFSFWAAVALLSSCNKEQPVPLPLEVSYNSVSGIWELTSWNGASLAEGSYFWMSLDRREHKFVIYQKLDSMYGRRITGTYSLRKDEVHGAVISGVYDYGTGSWTNEYIISDLLPSGQMSWTVLEGEADDVSVYTKRDEIPSSVLDDCLE